MADWGCQGRPDDRRATARLDLDVDARKGTVGGIRSEAEPWRREDGGEGGSAEGSRGRIVKDVGAGAKPETLCIRVSM